MLPKTRRLSDNKTIEKTKLSGKVYSGEIATFIVDSQETGLGSKFCVVVSTKVSKKAVDRNFIKRKVNLFLEKSLTKFKEGLNIVIIVKRNMLEKDQETIDKKLMELSGKAQLLK
jgi:ribonuclease P protein component